MKTKPKIVPTVELKIEDVPEPGANWQTIAAFALTYDPRELNAGASPALGLDDTSAYHAISELRGRLYVEQRRWNHYNREPDEAAMTTIRAMLKLIREKM